MILDLEKENIQGQITSNIVIIGGGTVGIYLAHRLDQLGVKDITIVESGGVDSILPQDLNIDYKQTGIYFRGANNGRSFGLGGTSVLWGGQLIPLSQGDYSDRGFVGIDEWPIDFSELERFFSIVEKDFGILHQNVSKDDPEASKYKLLSDSFKDAFDLRLSTWLPFSKRNFSQAFKEKIYKSNNIRVLINASVTDFVKDGSKIESTIVNSKIDINGNNFIISAGALESVKLMLNLNKDYDDFLTKQGSPIGKYFSDHLSLTCGEIKPVNFREYIRTVAPMFSGSIMRTPRLELSIEAQKSAMLTSAFAHFTFETDGNSGFDIVRNLLRKQQGEKQEVGFKFSNIKKILLDLFSMFTYRFIYKRLWVPEDATLRLQVDIEQLPSIESYIDLDEDKDCYGKNNLIINWKITEQDIDIIRKTASLILNAWNSSEMKSIGKLEINQLSDFDEFSAPYDVYHPTGGLRMGTRIDNSVVNKHQKVWNVDNLFINSTMVFPSAGSANPGSTHLALTARLAEYLVSNNQ